MSHRDISAQHQRADRAPNPFGEEMHRAGGKPFRFLVGIASVMTRPLRELTMPLRSAVLAAVVREKRCRFGAGSAIDWPAIT
jgi:hypothetical protein